MEETETDDIVKSPLDDRDYRYLRLPNGLKALLISDATTEKASAALSVRIGSLSDPDELPGLAHFCEHMLFLGTEKYPMESEYAEFVSQNGGTCNAVTSGEYTTFFFDIACDHLREVLDRFSQFFISPLFNADASDREVNAVDSENDKNMQVDGWRFSQVWRQTARPGHPYRKFGTGNKVTLQSRPLELGLDVRQELLNFHSRHYSANAMCLVLLGKESLTELSSLVVELFSPIENKNIPIPSFPEPPFSNNQLPMRVDYVPVKDVRQLQLVFPMADLTAYYDCDPSSYVAHLIGHEGQGSLLSYLRSLGWCNFLGAGAEGGAKGFMFFTISVDLTKEGEGHIEDVVKAVFQYLAMLRREGPKQDIFLECANLDEISFRFRDKEKPMAYTQHLSIGLHEFPPHDLLRAGLLRTYRPDLIEMVVDGLRPQFIRLGVLSQEFEGQTSCVEPWYGSPYNVQKIASDLLDSWSTVDTIPELFLPRPNEFIPTDFSIVSRPEGRMDRSPVLIKDSAMAKVWYKQDDTFFVPKAFLCFKISSPKIYESPSSVSATSLFANLLMDDLKEYTYDAEMAGIEYKISHDVYAMKISVGGFNHKQATLLSRIMSKMTQFQVDRQRFDIFREILRRHLRNFRAEQPHTHAMYYSSVILDSLVWTRDQMADALEKMTCEWLQGFIGELFSLSHVEALLHGNLTKQGSLELVEIVEEALRSGAGAQPLPSPLEHHRQVALEKRSASVFSVTNEVHSSGCVEFYLQVGLEETRFNVLLELLSQILREPCYDILRTKEQLGYIVVSGVKSANSVQGFRVLVQSTSASRFVEERIETFLVQAYGILESMEEESFEKHKKALAVKKLEKPKRLKTEAKRFWSEICMQQYHFNRDEVEVACLMELTKDDILKFYSEFISHEAPCRRKLSVHVTPTAARGNSEASKSQAVQSEKNNRTVNGLQKREDQVDSSLPEAVEITDISEFKSKLNLFPTIEPYISISLQEIAA